MKKYFTFMLLISFLAACSQTPDYKRPEMQLPQKWSEGKFGKTTLAAKEWWKSFKNPELDNLIAQALANNNDLLAGIERVNQARADLKIAGAPLAPDVELSAGGSRTITNPDSGAVTKVNSLSSAATISYELDLFGRNSAALTSSKADLAARMWAEEALHLAVMSDVAKGYFTVLNLRERVKIAETNLDNAKEILRMITAKVEVGTAAELELAEQKNSVASSEAAKIALIRQLDAAENALAVLLGKAPKQISFKGKNLANIRIPKISPVQPSRLLDLRPDIKEAEENLIAANADIGVAKAAFFPSIYLTSGGSIASRNFASPATTIFSLASSLTQPIFKGGSLDGGVEKATARQKELVEVYKKTVLTAFKETEDALNYIKTSAMREKALLTAMQAAGRAYDISKKSYDIGSMDYQTLLDTMDRKLIAEDNYSQARLERISAAINLFKAMGGGFY